ncbi:hypothetical protein BD779DRAFT_1509427 [Infundibulicybe gibba]|nr:hypothetical protein BD779DRAFT_1509427 [Infundibulicybe gibba]
MGGEETPDEYEVETVTSARVDKRRGRKPFWQFRVRWKGYGSNDDTWEPIESFEGSEGILERFWERANTGGRDVNNLKLFKNGEEFLLTGPPPPSITIKSNNQGLCERTPEESASSSKSRPGKRQHGSAGPADSENHPSTKRSRTSDMRESAPSTSKTLQPSPGKSVPHERGHRSILESPVSAHRPRGVPKRTLFSEIVPTSDDEADEIEMGPFEIETTRPSGNNSDLMHHAISSIPSSHVKPSPTEVVSAEDPADPDIDDLFDSVVDEITILPSHRARVEQPLVKMADDPNLAALESAISVKSRVTRPALPNKPTGNSMINSGLGRFSSGPKKKNTSSLLTFQKGTLKTLKGNYITPLLRPTGSVAGSSKIVADTITASDPIPEDQYNGETEIPGSTTRNEPPPSGQELLDLAGVNDVEDLPDFEADGATIEQNEAPDVPPALVTLQKTNPRLILLLSSPRVQNNLFPSTSNAIAVNANANAAWKSPTIFGPLGIGLNSPKPTPESSMATFTLALDSAVTIPVLLTETPPPINGTPALNVVISHNLSGPPGKFYCPESAIALLYTIRSGGSSGRIVMDSGATDEQRAHYDRFRARLNAGDLFVAMLGVEVLTFCSSDNLPLAQRLNLPSTLLGIPGSVIASRVVIENYSAYANAALQADSIRW